MKTWLRSPIEQVCGLCCARIHRDAVMQLLSSPTGHPWRKARCLQCAEGMPPELPALEQKQTAVTPTVKPTREFTRLGQSAGDWKTRSAGGGGRG